MWVVDQLSSNVLRLGAATGALQVQFGEPGDGPGQLSFPSCVALASDGALLVRTSALCVGWGLGAGERAHA